MSLSGGRSGTAAIANRLAAYQGAQAPAPNMSGAQGRHMYNPRTAAMQRGPNMPQPGLPAGGAATQAPAPRVTRRWNAGAQDWARGAGRMPSAAPAPMGVAGVATGAGPGVPAAAPGVQTGYGGGGGGPGLAGTFGGPNINTNFNPSNIPWPHATATPTGYPGAAGAPAPVYGGSGGVTTNYVPPTQFAAPATPPNAPTKQLAGGQQGYVLGGGSSGTMSAYDPNAGRQEAQPIGMQSYIAGQDQDQRQYERDVALMAVNPTERNDAYRQRTGLDSRVDPRGPADQEMSSLETDGSGGGYNKNDNSASAWFDWRRDLQRGAPDPYDVGGKLADIIARPAAGAADTFNKYTEGALDDFYDNYEDVAGMKDAGNAMLDDNWSKGYDEYERQKLRAGVGAERDHATRQLLDMQNRGMDIGSGSLQGAYNAAMEQMRTGEQDINARAFDRALNAKRVGGGLVGDAARAKYGTMVDQFNNPTELAAMIMEFMPELFPGGS